MWCLRRLGRYLSPLCFRCVCANRAPRENKDNATQNVPDIGLNTCRSEHREKTTLSTHHPNNINNRAKHAPKRIPGTLQTAKKNEPRKNAEKTLKTSRMQVPQGHAGSLRLEVCIHVPKIIHTNHMFTLLL